jgi:hypothetical protein
MEPFLRAKVPSPGGWFAPQGERAGWNWLPPGGEAVPLEWDMPRWVRVWARTPLLNWFASVWIWNHGYFLVWPPGSDAPSQPGQQPDVTPPDDWWSGVREPRRPIAPASAGAVALELEPEPEQDVQP